MKLALIRTSKFLGPYQKWLTKRTPNVNPKITSVSLNPSTVRTAHLPGSKMRYHAVSLVCPSIFCLSVSCLEG
jgi:hypothetical protein